VAVVGSNGHERGLQIRAANPAQAIDHRAFGFGLHRCQKRRLHFPVWRMISAVDGAELLPQELLGVPRGGAIGARMGSDGERRHPRRRFVLWGDEALFAHARKDDMAPAPGASHVRPGRQARRAADHTRDERALGQRQVFGLLSEQVLRHLFNAVHPGAEIDAIEVQLEDLILVEPHFEHQRQCGFLDFAADGPRIRQEQRARQLLRDGAAALRHRPRFDVLHHCAAQPKWIDPGVVAKAVILDRDDGIAHVF
jgi:hypothetical protein